MTERKKFKKAQTGSLLTPMPKSFDRTNPYNSAWIQHGQPSQSFHCAVHRDPMIGGACCSHAMPQQQHEIFHAQFYGHPSLEMSATPPPQATVQVSKYVTPDETDCMYLNMQAYPIGYDSPGHSLNNVNPNNNNNNNNIYLFFLSTVQHRIVQYMQKFGLNYYSKRMGVQ